MTTTPASLIAPHGGVLVERLASPSTHDTRLEAARTLPQVHIGARELSDLRLLGSGALSPLDGFMTEDRYNHVVNEMRLETGLVWTIPITLAVDHLTYRSMRNAAQVALVYAGTIVATLDVRDAYQPNKAHEALNVYRTDDPAHPGVNVLFESGEHYLGGPVTVFHSAYEQIDLSEYQLTPRQTREAFQARGWKSVVAFQTRNPIHRAHEYLQKCALETVDGLLIHPLAGETKSDDLDAATRFQCYERILSDYYPSERVMLSAFPASMRYAGPREAIFHALCRQNYGCTHFIVGRDHAGVGDYYGTYDAQAIFDTFEPSEIGILPLKFEHAFYCTACAGMASSKTCPHDQSHHVFLSGTKVRQMVRSGFAPPPEFTRPEVAEILIRAHSESELAAAKPGGAADVK